MAPKATVKVIMNWPDSIKQIFEDIQGAGGINDIDETGITFTIYSDEGLFELGQDFTDLKRQITSNWMEYFTFEVLEEETYD